MGGGASTLVDDLLARGYRDVSVLDMAPVAPGLSRARLGGCADHVTWLVGDITTMELPEQRHDVWHDRAVFHFLTGDRQRETYLRQVRRAVRPGGHVIVATFGPDGPLKCSGLEVMRYDASSLHGEFGPRFRLLDHVEEYHRTPFGATQQFLYCLRGFE